MTDISFDASMMERKAARSIATRAKAIYAENGVKRDRYDIEMDLIATHANGCPLDLARMAEADDFNLMHDVGGIGRHLDRDTGKLTGHFRPRFTRKS